MRYPVEGKLLELFVYVYGLFVENETEGGIVHTFDGLVHIQLRNIASFTVKKSTLK